MNPYEINEVLRSNFYLNRDLRQDVLTGIEVFLCKVCCLVTIFISKFMNYEKSIISVAETTLYIKYQREDGRRKFNGMFNRDKVVKYYPWIFLAHHVWP